MFIRLQFATYLLFIDSTFMRILFAAMLMSFALASPQLAQEPGGDDSGGALLKVTLAKTDAEGNIIEDPAEFKSTDIPLYCYVDLKDDEPVAIKVRFLAVKAKGMRPNSVIVTLQHKTKKGDNGASFHASPNGKWSEGDYAVEVFIDGKLVEKREFRISP